jgi:putative PIN family toxin of toxin-antitoxin system
LPPPLIVLDTGVVVRALTGDPDSASSQVVRAVATGEVRLALSDDFLSEMARVMRYPHIEQRIGSAGRAFAVALDLALMGTLFRTRRYDWPSIPDPDDGWMLDLALASEADYIIAWDPHLTGATVPFPVEVLEPPDLLTRLQRP